MMRLLSNMLSNQWNLKASQTFRNSSRNRWVGSARSENPSASFTQLSSKLLTGEHDAINWQLSPCVLSKVHFGKTKTSMQPVCGWIAPMLLLLSHVSSPQDLMAFPAFAPLGAPPYYILSHIMSSAGVILDSSSIRSPPAATAKLCARHWQRCFVRESPLTWAGSEVHSELSSLDLMLVHIRAAGQLRSRARHPLNLSKTGAFTPPDCFHCSQQKAEEKNGNTGTWLVGFCTRGSISFSFFLLCGKLEDRPQRYRSGTSSPDDGVWSDLFIWFILLFEFSHSFHYSANCSNAISRNDNNKPNAATLQGEQTKS